MPMLCFWLPAAIQFDQLSIYTHKHPKKQQFDATIYIYIYISPNDNGCRDDATRHSMDCESVVYSVAARYFWSAFGQSISVCVSLSVALCVVDPSAL